MIIIRLRALTKTREEGGAFDQVWQGITDNFLEVSEDESWRKSGVDPQRHSRQKGNYSFRGPSDPSFIQQIGTEHHAVLGAVPGAE